MSRPPKENAPSAESALAKQKGQHHTADHTPTATAPQQPALAGECDGVDTREIVSMFLTAQILGVTVEEARELKHQGLCHLEGYCLASVMAFKAKREGELARRRAEGKAT